MNARSTLPVLTALGGAALLLFLTLGPLRWVGMGMPWMPLVIAFAVIPLLDAVVGSPPHPSTPLPSGVLHRWVPRIQLPAQALLLWQAVSIAPQLSWLDTVVFAIAVGTVTGGLGITVAHELTHRKSRLDRAIAKALLVCVAYGYFAVEHVRGHHVRVGTPDDPATAPRGMSVYRFVVRSIVGSFAHAWRLEALRLQHAGRGPVSWRNWVLTGSALSLLLLVAATGAGGLKGALLFVLQATCAVVLLEIINYIEHYGLTRHRSGTGFEAVRPQHSWNADFTVSHWVLFRLQLHSDHHAHMNRPYEQLRSVPSAPQLPAGYPAMVIVALLPPLWFAVMHPRLAARGC